jgi:hypothetical protein
MSSSHNPVPTLTDDDEMPSWLDETLPPDPEDDSVAYSANE